MILDLHTVRIDKGDVRETSLIPILEVDADFKENKEQFREDTIKLGFKNEAERVSKEIFDKFKGHNNYAHRDQIESDYDENNLLSEMLNEVFGGVDNFLGNSSAYNEFEFEVIETEFEYIIAFAFTMAD